MFKFNINRKASKEAAAKKAALRADLEKLMEVAQEPFTVQTAIEHRSKLYSLIQMVRKNHLISELPKCINTPGGWSTPVEQTFVSYLDDEGMWREASESWMRQWVSHPTEIGPMVNEKVTPMGAWMYNHQGWCQRLSGEIKKYLATTT